MVDVDATVGALDALTYQTIQQTTTVVTERRAVVARRLELVGAGFLDTGEGGWWGEGKDGILTSY